MSIGDIFVLCEFCLLLTNWRSESFPNDVVVAVDRQAELPKARSQCTFPFNNEERYKSLRFGFLFSQHALTAHRTSNPINMTPKATHTYATVAVIGVIVENCFGSLKPFNSRLSLSVVGRWWSPILIVAKFNRLIDVFFSKKSTKYFNIIKSQQTQ